MPFGACLPVCEFAWNMRLVLEPLSSPCKSVCFCGDAYSVCTVYGIVSAELLHAHVCCSGWHCLPGDGCTYCSFECFNVLYLIVVQCLDFTPKSDNCISLGPRGFFSILSAFFLWGFEAFVGQQWRPRPVQCMRLGMTAILSVRAL